MQWRRMLFLCASVAAALVAVRQSPADDLSALRLASLHLSAIITVQNWAAFAYGIRPAPQRLYEPASTSGCVPARVRRGNTTTQTFCLPDGSSGTHTFCSEPSDPFDFSVTQELRFPDGLRERFESVYVGTFPIDDRTRLAQYEIVHRLSSGASARYLQLLRAERLPDRPGGIPVYQTRFATSFGELILADGRRARFHLVQPRPPRTPWTDTLDLDLPEGEHLQWQVIVDGDGVRLDKTACGTYTAGNRSVAFCLTRSEQNYLWTLSDARGLNGQFVVSPDFSGYGRALRGRDLEFLCRWDARARASVLLADGQMAVAGPSAGAQAFANFRFAGIVAGNGPRPGYQGSFGTPSSGG